MLYGQGAGRMATASAVVGDCLDIIFNESKRISYGPVESQVKSMKNIDDVVSKYYISLTTVDEPGVLQTITGTLNKNGISIESITQKTNIDSESVPIIIVTHETEEKNIQQAIQKINELKEVEGESKLIRILE